MSFFTDREIEVMTRTEQAGRDEEDSIDAARESERERCAKIAENSHYWESPQVIAERIRSGK